MCLFVSSNGIKWNFSQACFMMKQMKAVDLDPTHICCLPPSTYCIIKTQQKGKLYFFWQYINSVCCCWVYINVFLEWDVDVSCYLLCVGFIFVPTPVWGHWRSKMAAVCGGRSSQRARKQKTLRSSNISPHAPPLTSVFLPLPSVIMFSAQLLQTKSGSQQSCSFSFFFINWNIVVRATCLFCAIKGLLQMSNQNKGSWSAFTCTSIFKYYSRYIDIFFSFVCWSVKCKPVLVYNNDKRLMPILKRLKVCCCVSCI